MNYAERCRIAEQCLPDAPYRSMLTNLHTEMLETIDAMQSALDDAVAKLAARYAEVERLRALVKRGICACDQSCDEDLLWMVEANAALSEEVKGGAL